MDDLQTFNVLIIPDGNGGRMRRELGDDGGAKLKAWVRSGGMLTGYGGAGDLAANKDVELSTTASVAPDSGVKADSTAAGNEPALISSTAPARDRPEWIPGAIFRATLDTTHWLTLGYERNRMAVFIDGDTFWRPSKGGANAATFTDPVDSLVLSGFTWPDRSEEHTSELQSLAYLVCRLLLEKKKTARRLPPRRRCRNRPAVPKPPASWTTPYRASVR